MVTAQPGGQHEGAVPFLHCGFAYLTCVGEPFPNLLPNRFSTRSGSAAPARGPRRVSRRYPMTLNRQDGLGAVHAGVANRGREIAGAFLPGRPRVGAVRLQEGPPLARPNWVGWTAYLLGWTASLSFCAGLFGLAVSPALEVAVPRWFILTYGVGCPLLAL